jgi:hypothetical protein
MKRNFVGMMVELGRCEPIFSFGTRDLSEDHLRGVFVVILPLAPMHDERKHRGENITGLLFHRRVHCMIRHAP